MRPVYEPLGLSNSQAISCPSRASFAHFDDLFGFCSSQKWLCSSVNVLSFEGPNLSVHVFMSLNMLHVRCEDSLAAAISLSIASLFYVLMRREDRGPVRLSFALARSGSTYACISWSL